MVIRKCDKVQELQNDSKKSHYINYETKRLHSKNS